MINEISLDLPFEFPLELTDLICDKMDRRKLVQICIQNSDKFSAENLSETPSNNSLYNLNENRIKKYWREMGIYEMIKFNDISGVKYLQTDTFISDYNYLAITVACKFSGLEMIKYLVSIGADISTQFETIACRYSFQREQLEILKYYISLGYKPKTNHNIIFSISKCEDLEIVKYMVEIGAIIPYSDDAIIIASNYSLENVKYFVKNGANPRANNDQPLISASNYNRLDIMKYLISLGADPCAQENTILKRISSFGQSKVIKYILPLIIEKGGEINFDKLISLARENYYYRIMKYLEEEKKKYLEKFNQDKIK
jgi:ankyrin repeat protein